MRTKIVFTPFHYHTSRRLRSFFIGAGIICWFLATLAAFTPMLPHLLYRLSPHTPTALAQTLSQPLSDQNLNQTELTKPNLPPKDATLPRDNTLIIDKIGVNGVIHEGDDWQHLLELGIWRVPDFGTPEDDLPIILAAHRWGYLNWSNSFRRHNSFYNLPKLTISDTITIVWNQRQYQYRITTSVTAEKIPNYNSDLILYTCQLWNSPIRIFKLATHIN